VHETPDRLASPATVESLEYESYLRLLAELTATDVGRERMLATGRAASLPELDRRHRLYEEAASLLGNGRLVPSFDEPLRTIVESLGSGDTEILGGELNRLAAALRAVRSARRSIGAADPECPELAAAAGRLGDLDPLLRGIERTLDRRGRVRDDASEALVRLGGAVRSSREAIYRDLRDYSRRHKDELAEETMPLHEGRVVVLLKAGSRGRGDGLVHRGSGTGRSLYFEPLAVVESNNRMRAAQEQEDAERQRLLRQLVETAREALGDVERHLDFLALLDRLQAAFDFSELCEARPVEISPRHELVITGGRHPLLEPRLAGLRERALGHAGHVGEVVPLELRLEPESRVLVITGPNAGGKTVALKTVGLMALAAQVGLPFPAARGSCAPFLDGIVATVGDEQDLLEDRSTFSGRLLRLREAWDAAGPDSLLLLDELGSGTDPDEGAALSIALLEGLLEKQAMALITTHLTPLAATALEQQGASCAAMQFDAGSHTPTFELLPGSPAGSEALALARRLGLPEAWLDRADALLGSDHRKLHRLLAEVESVREELARKRHEIEARRDELDRQLEESSRLREELAAEKVKVGRRAREDLDAFRREVKESLRGEVERLKEELESGRRRGLAAAAAERLFETAPEIEVEEAAASRPASIGDTVRHRALGWQGVVERLDRGKAEVSVHGKRLRCAVDELLVVEAAAEDAKPASSRREDPAPLVEAVAPELNLIGKRVEEALTLLDSYLDHALLTADGDLRIVHGHGTGRLKKAIREHLRDHPAAAAARPGRQEEGGDGATIVSLRD
jgi:DNA mismatch repair protein MutS2